MRKSVTSQCRYALLTSALQRDIAEGRYKVGEALPTEEKLCEQFDVSRHTVREALRQLKEIGLITSRQGLGSIVQASTAAARYVHSLDSYENFVDFLRQARGEMLVCDMRPMPEKLAKVCGLNLSAQRLWLHVQVLRYWGEDDLPTLLSDAYVDAKYSGVKDFYSCNMSMTEALEQQYGVTFTHIEQDIQAIALNKEQSQILQVKPRSAALQTIRRCLAANGEILIISCNIAPAERYTYSTKMRITSRT